MAVNELVARGVEPPCKILLSGGIVPRQTPRASTSGYNYAELARLLHLFSAVVHSFDCYHCKYGKGF